jgi:hypothetical protein
MAFYDDIHTNHGIVISFNPNPKYDFAAFARGYHAAATALARSFLAQTGYRDYEGYPVVFLYRHAFELYLKNIIYWAARLNAFAGTPTFDAKLQNTHRLTDLAKVASALLAALFPDDQLTIGVNPQMVKLSGEFDEIDPISYAYRYPIDTRGNPSTPNHQVVDIGSIFTHMEPFLEALNNVCYGLEGVTDEAQAAYEIVHDFSLN